MSIDEYEVVNLLSSDTININSLLMSIQNDIQIIENYHFKKGSNHGLNAVATGMLQDIGLDYLKRSYGFKKKYTNSILQTQKTNAKNQNELNIHLQLDSNIVKLKNLINITSYQKNGRILKNSISKLNQIYDAKRSQKKISRMKKIISELKKLDLFYTSNRTILREENKKQSQRRILSNRRLSISEFKKLIVGPENRNIDFKQILYNKKSKWSGSEKSEFGKDVTSFANTKGGLIILGVADKTNNLIGINSSLLNEETMYEIISKYTEQPVNDIDIYVINHLDLDFAIINIPESSNKPHEFRDIHGVWQTYIRMGSINRRARASEIKIM